jgi:hypothetical protein
MDNKTAMFRAILSPRNILIPKTIVGKLPNYSELNYIKYTIINKILSAIGFKIIYRTTIIISIHYQGNVRER